MFTLPILKRIMDIPIQTEIVIERVVDGDTIALSEPIAGADKIRLDGIDTPETRSAKCRKERNLGYEAKGFARALLEGRAVTVVHSGKKGRYGRLIARIVIDGQDYSQIMLDKGYAVRWTKAWRETPKEKRWC